MLPGNGQPNTATPEYAAQARDHFELNTTEKKQVQETLSALCLRLPKGGAQTYTSVTLPTARKERVNRWRHWGPLPAGDGTRNLHGNLPRRTTSFLWLICRAPAQRQKGRSASLPAPCTCFVLVTELRTETQSCICTAAPLRCSRRCLRGDGHVIGGNKPVRGREAAHWLADGAEENRCMRETHRNSPRNGVVGARVKCRGATGHILKHSRCHIKNCT